MHIFDAARTREALPFERPVPALRALFERGREVPARQVHELTARELLVHGRWLRAGTHLDLIGGFTPAMRVFSAHDVQGTVAALCRGDAQGRRDARDRTVFKPVGTALEDLAAAMLVAGLDAAALDP